MKFRRQVVLIAILWGTTACQEQPSASQEADATVSPTGEDTAGEVALNELVNNAQKLIKAQLTDPYSAQFENLTTNATRDILCGKVNSKNQAGGYAGPRNFVYDTEGEGVKALIDPFSSSVDTGSMSEFELKAGIAAVQASTAAFKRCGFTNVQALPSGGFKAGRNNENPTNGS